MGKLKLTIVQSLSVSIDKLSKSTGIYISILVLTCTTVVPVSLVVLTIDSSGLVRLDSYTMTLLSCSLASVRI